MSEHSICLLNDSFPPVIDGVANVVVNYARCITEAGGRAVVATPAYPGADELYISWKDAVARAAERYEIVIDRYRSGGYKRPKRPSDEFFRMHGELMTALSQLGSLEERLQAIPAEHMIFPH